MPMLSASSGSCRAANASTHFQRVSPALVWTGGVKYRRAAPDNLASRRQAVGRCRWGLPQE